MFPPLHRLPSDSIREVLRRGNRVSGKYFVLQYTKTKNAPRFAIVVSARIDKRATVRNRIRRIVRESVRRMPSDVYGIDCVIIVRQNVAGVPAPEIRREFNDLLSHEKSST